MNLHVFELSFFRALDNWFFIERGRIVAHEREFRVFFRESRPIRHLLCFGAFSD